MLSRTIMPPNRPVSMPMRGPMPMQSTPPVRGGGPLRVMGSYKKGGKVNKTGAYKLHKGEKVVGRKVKMNKLLGCD